MRPKFTPDIAGDYLVTLTVASGAAVSAPVSFKISTFSQPPRASVAASRDPVSGAFALDAIQSIDVDGDALTYSWSLLASPAGSTVQIQNASTSRASILPVVAGDYTVGLTVTDDRGAVSSIKSVTITRGRSAPVAAAGPDHRVSVGATVWVDAFASTDLDGDKLSATWKLVSKPVGSSAHIGTQVLGRVPVVTDIAGDYVAQVAVSDGISTSYDAVVISAGATASASPIADAGRYPVATVGVAVALEGTASSDIDGDLLKYRWSILAKPAGSSTVISEPTSARPMLQPDIAGSYVVQLAVTDQTGLTSYDVAVVSDVTGPPVAHSGIEQLADTNCQAQLSAAQSVGSNLQYQWSVLGLDMPGSIQNATIAAPLAAETSVALSQNGSQLAVAVLNGPVAVPFTGVDSGEQGTGLRLNSMGRLTLPSGALRTVWKIRNASNLYRGVSLQSTSGSFSVSYAISAQSELYLLSPVSTGTAAHRLLEGNRLIDEEASILTNFVDNSAVSCGGPLLWQSVTSNSKVSICHRPPGNPDNAQSLQVSVNALSSHMGHGDALGECTTGPVNCTPDTRFAVFQVATTNGVGVSASSVLVTTGNVMPVASISGPVTVASGSTAVLDGSASSDANGTALTFKWALISRPDGSTTTLSGSTTTQATVIPDRRGIYVVQLVVSDGTLHSAPKTFAVEVPNRAPEFTSTPVTVARQNNNYTYALSATDPDGDNTVFELITAPAGMQLSGATISWTPLASGSFSVAVRVKDGLSGAANQSFTIDVAPATIGNLPPDLAAIGNKAVQLGGLLSLTLSASDPNGDRLFYAATGLPPGATLNASSGVLTWTPVSPTPSTFSVVFSVSDGQFRDSETVLISVDAGDPALPAALSGRAIDAAASAGGAIVPVAGAMVRIGTVSSTTASDGTFTLAGLPAGVSQLEVVKSGYAHSARSISIYGGLTTALAPDVALIAIAGNGTQINPAGSTTVSNTAIPNVTVAIGEGTAKNPDGSPFTGTLSISDIPPSSVILPDVAQTCSIQSLTSATPVSFAAPATIELPNRDALAGNTKVFIWGFDSARSAFVRVGSGIVSADGSKIITTAGGLTEAGAFFATPVGVEAGNAADQPQGKWVPSLLGQGNLRAAVSLPSHQSVGLARASSLIYNSVSAAVRGAVSSVITIPIDRMLPGTLETQVFVEGVRLPNVLVTNLTQPAVAGSLLLNENAIEKVSRELSFDASWLPTGSHAFRILTFARYGCSSIATEQKGTFFVNNKIDSEYGRGWKNVELQKVNFDADGSATVEEPDGSLTKFEARPKISDFTKASFPFVTNGGLFPAVADFDLDGRRDFAHYDTGTGKVVVHLNSGNSGFRRVHEFELGDPNTVAAAGYLTPSVTSISANDVTGDGIPDLVTANQSVGARKGLWISAGLGNGDFAGAVQVPGTETESYRYAHVVDLDGDGHLDLVCIKGMFGDVVALYGRAEGGFTQPLPVGDYAQSRFVITDLNNDGRLDVYYTSGPTGLAYLNKGARTFQQTFVGGATSSGTLDHIYDVSDVDRDGKKEVLIANTSSITVLTFDPRSGNYGSFVNSRSIAVDGAAGTVASGRFADIDGDGNEDILIGTFDGAAPVLWSRNDGKANFAAPTTLVLGHAATVNMLADMDGDGAADLIAVNRFTGFVDFANPVPGKFASPFPDFTSFEKLADGTYVRRYKDGSYVTFDASGRQNSVVDANGNVSRYEYDTAGRLLKSIDPAGGETVYAYSSGRLASITDPTGKIMQFTVAANGGLEVMTQADGADQKFGYDASGLLTSNTDQRGNTTTATYNATAQLTQVTFADGASVKLDIAKAMGIGDLSGPAPTPENFVRPEDRVATLQDARGKVIKVEVNAWGGVVRQLDAIGRLTVTTRDERNLVTSIDAPSSVSSTNDRILTEFDYDTQGNLTELREAIGTDLQRIANYVYEPVRSRMIKKIEPAAPGIYTRAELNYEFDAKGNLVKSIDQLGKFKTWTYNAQGLKLTEADEKGNTTTFAYDAQGRLESMTDALGFVTRYVRDAAGNVLREIGAEGRPEQRTVRFEYDILNRTISTIDGEGHAIFYGYDVGGNNTLIRDSSGVEGTRVYDTRNRVVHQSMPATGTSSFEYDPLGNLLKIVDSSGASAELEYDDVNRKILERDASGQSRSITYDLRDNVATDSDALGNTTTYTYDLLDRLTERKDPTGHTWKWKYDIFDKQIETTKPGGAVLTFRYDARHLLNTIFGAHFRTYQYDDARNLTNVYDTDGEGRAYTYDALNRANLVTWSSGLYGGGHTLAYTYDGLGRRTTSKDNRNATNTYTWDRADRLTAITSPAGKTVQMNYDTADRATRIAFPSGNETRMTYDTGAASSNTGRLKSVGRGLDNAGIGGSPLNQLLGTFSYTYDTRGNIKTVSEPRRARSYTYDALERLTKVEEPQPSPNPPVTREAYTLDAEGNRVSSHASAFHVTAPANRLIEDETATYEYNLDGNMITKAIKATAPNAGANAGKVWRYTYDAMDRLKQAQVFASAGAVSHERQVSYSYDGFDNRVRRIESTGPGTSYGGWFESGALKTIYFHDGDQVDSFETFVPDGGFWQTFKRHWITRGTGTDDYVMLTPDTAPYYFQSNPPSPIWKFAAERALRPIIAHVMEAREVDAATGQILCEIGGDQMRDKRPRNWRPRSAQHYLLDRRNFRLRVRVSEGPELFERAACDVNTPKLTSKA